MIKKNFGTFMILVFILLLLIPVSGWTTVYVDESNKKGPWDGNSWATAYRSIQDGLTDAENNKEEVWVAKGVYKPTLSNDRNISFQLKTGVDLYGGFAGHEGLRSERDPEINLTVLSGEIGDPDNKEDNSYHVVTSADNTIIDGFTIINGYAMPMGGFEFRLAGGSRQSHGYVSASKDVSTGGEPSGDMGGHGPSQGAPDSGPAGNMQGRGAAQGEPGGRPAGNIQGSGAQQRGEQGGGGQNASGGGMIVSHSNVTINNCVFKDNLGGRGGAIYMMGSQRGPGGGSRGETGISENQPHITNCDFINNHATFRGGGMHVDRSVLPVFIGCTFIDNSCDEKGGGLYNDYGCSPTLINCVFSGNSAQKAGAIGNDGDSSPVITNCTFTNNYAEVLGAAVYQGTGPSNNPVITNCIIWGNKCDDGPSEIYNWHHCNPVVTYSCVEGGYEGTGNIDADPMFVDPANGDFRLDLGSPCIDSANGAAAPQQDISGNLRYDDTGMPDGVMASASKDQSSQRNSSTQKSAPADMGAFERQSSSIRPKQNVVYVTGLNKTGTWNGKTWETAFKELQAAIDYAYSAHSEVWVAQGTYMPTETNDRTVSIVMREGVNIYGGFKGNETDKTQRDFKNNITTLSGDIGIKGDNRDNSYHVVIGADKAGIDGFVITGGNANGKVYQSKGGGMVNYAATVVIGYPFGTSVGFAPIVTNCTFTHNDAIEGGAMYNYDRKKPVISGCVFEGNSAEFGGAIVDRVGADSIVSDCTFRANHAKWCGGAYYVDYGSRPNITDSVFKENTTDGHGGAMYMLSRASQLDESAPTVTNCTFTGNSAGKRGGAIANYDKCILTVDTCQFTENYAGLGGGAISNDFKTNAVITASKFSGNKAGQGKADIDTDESSEVTISE